MKSPLTGEDMIIIEDPQVVTYQDKTVRYYCKMYLCAESGETYTNTRLDEINLRRLKFHFEEV
jgi:hypothetical protein